MKTIEQFTGANLYERESKSTHAHVLSLRDAGSASVELVWR